MHMWKHGPYTEERPLTLTAIILSHSSREIPINPSLPMPATGNDSHVALQAIAHVIPSPFLFLVAVFYVFLNIKTSIIKTVGQKMVLSDTIIMTAAVINIDFVSFQRCFNPFYR
jgi:hypothetical protein